MDVSQHPSSQVRGLFIWHYKPRYERSRLVTRDWGAVKDNCGENLHRGEMTRKFMQTSDMSLRTTRTRRVDNRRRLSAHSWTLAVAALLTVGATSCGPGATKTSGDATTRPSAPASSIATRPVTEPSVSTTADTTTTGDTAIDTTTATAIDTTTATAIDATTRVAATSTAAVVSVPEVLRFSAQLVGGGQLDGATYAGRPVVFWFWAPT